MQSSGISTAIKCPCLSGGKSPDDAFESEEYTWNGLLIVHQHVIGRKSSAFDLGLKLNLGEKGAGSAAVKSGNGFFGMDITWVDKTFQFGATWTPVDKGGASSVKSIVCPDGQGGYYFKLNSSRDGQIDLTDFTKGKSSEGLLEGTASFLN